MLGSFCGVYTADTCSNLRPPKNALCFCKRPPSSNDVQFPGLSAYIINIRLEHRIYSIALHNIRPNNVWHTSHYNIRDAIVLLSCACAELTLLSIQNTKTTNQVLLAKLKDRKFLVTVTVMMTTTTCADMFCACVCLSDLEGAPHSLTLHFFVILLTSVVGPSAILAGIRLWMTRPSLQLQQRCLFII